MEPGADFLHSLSIAENGLYQQEFADRPKTENRSRSHGQMRQGRRSPPRAPRAPRNAGPANSQEEHQHIGRSNKVSLNKGSGMSRRPNTSQSLRRTNRSGHESSVASLPSPVARGSVGQSSRREAWPLDRQGQRTRRRSPSPHRAKSPNGRHVEGALSPKYIPAATSYQELSISDRRLGNEAIKTILDRGRTHNGLIERAQASVDTSEPRTLSINRWHQTMRMRDPMPELELPKDVKLHSSWTQLAELKWRKDWHERLLKSTKSNIDVQLPKHVKVYQRRKKEELRKLVQGDRVIT